MLQIKTHQDSDRSRTGPGLTFQKLRSKIMKTLDPKLKKDPSKGKGTSGNG